MTIDDFIIHSQEVARKNRENADSLINNPYIPMNIDVVEMANKCVEIAEEHEQLAEWLEDYKALKVLFNCSFVVTGQTVEEFEKSVKNKTVDEFVQMAAGWNQASSERIPYVAMQKIAEQLKGEK